MFRIARIYVIIEVGEKMKKEDFTWDFQDFFLNDEDFIETKKQFLISVKNLEESFKTLNLEEKLKNYYGLALTAEKLHTYAELKYDLNLASDIYAKYKDEAYIAKGKIAQFKNIINEEILKIDMPLDMYMHKYPNMQKYYMHFYDVLRCKKHNINSTLITKEGIAIENVNTLYNMLMNVELPCEDIQINKEKVKADKSSYNQYSKSKDRNIRKNIFLGFMHSLANVNKSVSGLLNLRYQMCYDIASEKNFNSILEQVIIEDDLDMKIIDNLIIAVHNNLELLNRYLTLKKQRQGLEDFHFYDLTINEDYNPKYTFNEALDVIKEALKVMGEDYQQKLDIALSSGCIDAFERKNKFGGGYHFRNYIKPMILMNYKDNFREVAALAHELGHAVNGIYIRENQPYQDFHFSAFLSEVASTVNEDRVEKYLYDKAETENKIIHLEQIIDKMTTAIYFQTLFLEFQKILCEEIEQGNSLSASLINETFINLYKKYYYTVDIDEELKYLWQTRLHLFYGQYRYYNFQYATGKIAALVINKNIDEGNITDYLNFLTIDGSKPTLEALKQAGVDLSDPQIYDNAFSYLNNLLNDYERLLTK